MTPYIDHLVANTIYDQLVALGVSRSAALLLALLVIAGIALAAYITSNRATGKDPAMTSDTPASTPPPSAPAQPDHHRQRVAEAMTSLRPLDHAAVLIAKRRNPLAWVMLAVFWWIAAGCLLGGNWLAAGFFGLAGLAFLWVREDAER